jgi:4-hydroxy-3-methylbut-2-en-1-yl diphosphate reductase
MARQFDVPVFYRSPIVSAVKAFRREKDPRKKDLSPTVLDFGPVRFKLARHFGFCYGVENAIEIAYRALEDNPGRRIFLLSEMIHNPHVNEDLQRRGIRFLRTTLGEQLIPFSELQPDDVVIIPAFGTTIEVKERLSSAGVDVEAYNTTCPFVEKVWQRSHRIGRMHYTVVVHGKRFHEETRATFSHAQQETTVVVIRDLDEAGVLADIIRGRTDPTSFFEYFRDRCSSDFDPATDLERIGVVNQTTMLATETAAIAKLLKSAMIGRYGESNIDSHFADTSDTLCYATNENQDATRELIRAGADTAIIVGGANSSNTSHLVELCADKMPTFFIGNAGQIHGRMSIDHFDMKSKQYVTTEDWLGDRDSADILLTAGASCPDVLLDDVIRRICDLFPTTHSTEDVIATLKSETEYADYRRDNS